jgi:NADPH:quinone reductase-like Zn-dependent oxidoreductase
VKAIIQRRYGPPEQVLELTDVERPTCTDTEVLVRVHASSVAGDDWHLMRGLPYVARLATGLRRPRHRIPGRDLAGTVEEVGPAQTGFAPGDEVFGWSNGSFAEYVSVPPEALAHKPANLSLAEAAAVPVSAFTALQGLRDKGEVVAGSRVLIIGASGGVGSFAVQIAAALGAEVTGVCSTPNVALVRALGARHVVDYTKEDLADGGRSYDVILDMVGDRRLGDLRRTLSSSGTLVMVGGTGGRLFKGTSRFLRGLVLSKFSRQALRPLVHADDKDDLLAVRELIEAEKVTPVVSDTYPLSRVPDAIRHFEGGHARGKVVVQVAAAEAPRAGPLPEELGAGA